MRAGNTTLRLIGGVPARRAVVARYAIHFVCAGLAHGASELVNLTVTDWTAVAVTRRSATTTLADFASWACSASLARELCRLILVLIETSGAWREHVGTVAFVALRAI